MASIKETLKGGLNTLSTMGKAMNPFGGNAKPPATIPEPDMGKIRAQGKKILGEGYANNAATAIENHNGKTQQVIQQLGN